MAPVTCRVADRQQDRLVLGLGGGERRLSSGLPMHRIVLVLQQIGAGFLAKAVVVCCRHLRLLREAALLD
jgi:hypothetical protein